MSTSFNLNETAGISQNTIPASLEGNKIHEVIFKGCEKADYKDGAYKVLKLIFANEDGEFTHTIFEPTSEDMEERQGAFGPEPARFVSTKLLIKHLIDAVNPTLAANINEGKASFSPSDWESFRDLTIKATDPGKGTKTKIKLMQNKKGEAVFPGFLAAYNKAGQLYMTTNCIGSNIFFTNKELDRIKKATTAKPTSVSPSSSSFGFGVDDTANKAEGFDIDISKI